MSGIATAIGGGAVLGLVGSAMSSNAADNAAQTQAQAASQASQLQYQEFQQQQANQAPWIAAGTQALGQMQTMSANAPTFTAQDFANNMDPAYQFDLQQGQQAIERSAAAQGGLQSGSTLKSLSDYAQGQASNEYQNAYSRFMNNQNMQFNRLASIAGTGQTATGQMGQAGQSMASQVGSNMMGAANAQGAAGIASANAWSSGLSNAGNMGMQGLMINRMPSYGGLLGTGGGSGLTPTQSAQLNQPVPTSYQSSVFGTISGD